MWTSKFRCNEGDSDSTNREYLPDDSDEDDQKRVVRSAKDKRFDEMTTTSKLIEFTRMIPTSNRVSIRRHARFSLHSKSSGFQGYFSVETMAFSSRLGGLIKSNISHNVAANAPAPMSSSMLNAIRMMSSKLFFGGLSWGTDN